MVPVEYACSICLTLGLLLEPGREVSRKTAELFTEGCPIKYLPFGYCDAALPVRWRTASDEESGTTLKHSSEWNRTKGHEETCVFHVSPNLTGFFQQPLKPGDLRLQLSDQLPTVILIDCGAVHNVFCPTCVTQCAQSLAVVHSSRRNGWKHANCEHWWENTCISSIQKVKSGEVIHCLIYRTYLLSL